MKQHLLLPNKYKKFGWFLFCPMLLLGIIAIATNYEAPWLNLKTFALISGFVFDKHPAQPGFIEANLTNTVLGVLFIIGALLVGFSKEKNEDEYISSMRLNALLWAVLVNYSLLIVAFLLVYELPFFTVMTFNMFTVLLLFILRFHYLLCQNKKALSDEE